MRFTDLLTPSVAAQMEKYKNGNVKLNVTRTDLGHNSSNLTLQFIDDKNNNVATLHDKVATDAWESYVTFIDEKMISQANNDDKVSIPTAK